ncbi:MAG: Gfo/Idh/MocA family protein [Planctomycetota bacterium]
MNIGLLPPERTSGWCRDDKALWVWEDWAPRAPLLLRRRLIHNRAASPAARRRSISREMLQEHFRAALPPTPNNRKFHGTRRWPFPPARAGKHVYCEKPLTLNIDEGQLLHKVLQDSGVVFQVGTRYRSDHHCRLACETVHAGRLGKLKRITVGLGKNPRGGPFKVEDPPPHLNWDL